MVKYLSFHNSFSFALRYFNLFEVMSNNMHAWHVAMLYDAMSCSCHEIRGGGGSRVLLLQRGRERERERECGRGGREKQKLETFL
jgi:hypothetical protein